MAESSNAFDGCCPGCGRIFSLADLKRMAVGDGWQRAFWAILPDGSRAVVTFDEFDPVTMREADGPGEVPG